MNKIIYLDAAASSLKPDAVISAEHDFLQNKYANAGRGVCARAAGVDHMVAAGRRRVAEFINAAHPAQVIFTSGTTDSMNRIVAILSAANIGGTCPVVAVSDLDHHSARLPWMALEMRGAAKLVVWPLDQDFNYDISRAPAADVLVITAMSNVMGVAQDVSAIIRRARAINPDVITVVDAAQYVVHDKIDVTQWDADFVCFSAHKIGADTGLGIMYIKNPENFPADKFGGGMVSRVDENDIILNPAPEKFEAGTLPLTQIAGLAPAIDYLVEHRPDTNLIKYLYDQLSDMPRIRILTTRDAAILSFVVHDMHVLDFGTLMGARGVCMRVGNMCATWIHKALGISGSIRISVGPWNTMEEMAEVARMIKDLVK